MPGLDIFAEPIDPSIRREGDTFIFDFSNLGVICELSRVEVGKAEAHGLLFVKTTLPGYDPVVSFDKRLNLTPANGFTSPAKYLSSRLDLPSVHGVTWESLLERVAGETLLQLRDPGESIILGTLPPRTTPLFAVAPLALQNERTILFGDGGTGKSTLALLIAVSYRTGRNVVGLQPYEHGEVMYLDWESDAQTVDWRLRALVKGLGADGMDVDGKFPHMIYKQQFYPLIETAEALGREIHDRNVGMVVIDSATWAVAGSAKEEDAVLPMFNAMRRWGCSVVVIDHVAGANADKSERPYGSVFKRNAARLLWNVRLAETKDTRLHVGLYSSKANYTGQQAPVGFCMTYLADGMPTTNVEMADEIQVEREDVRQQATPDRGNAKDRIRAALGAGSMTAGEIWAVMNNEPDAKRVTLKTVQNLLSPMVTEGTLSQVVEAGEERKWRLR